MCNGAAPKRNTNSCRSFSCSNISLGFSLVFLSPPLPPPLPPPLLLLLLSTFSTITKKKSHHRHQLSRCRRLDPLTNTTRMNGKWTTPNALQFDAVSIQNAQDLQSIIKAGHVRRPVYLSRVFLHFGFPRYHQLNRQDPKQQRLGAPVAPDWCTSI